MRQIIHCFLFSLVISSASSAQLRSTADPDKYRINLPDYWKPGNKIWEILDEKLPQVAEELKDKQLCGDDCKPKYSIEFEMSEPEVLDYHTNHISTGTNTDTWEFVTLYSFPLLYTFLMKKISCLLNSYWLTPTRSGG